MTWLWSSYEEFAKYVSPKDVRNSRFVEITQRDSRFGCIVILSEAFEEFRTALHNLKGLGFESESAVGNREKLSAAQKEVWDLARSGETLLSLHKRLATSHWADLFLSRKEISEEWERYQKSDWIFGEIRRFMKGCDDLCKGFFELSREDEEFLIHQLKLPKKLRSDFVVARDLFSVGMDEVGLLVVGRGVEAVLRETARLKRLVIVDHGKSKGKPAQEADFYDLIEVLYRTRFRKDGSRFLEKKDRHLLHFLRDIRNASAHPSEGSSNEERNAREVARLAAAMADKYWQKVTDRTVRIASRAIEKDW